MKTGLFRQQYKESEDPLKSSGKFEYKFEKEGKLAFLKKQSKLLYNNNP